MRARLDNLPVFNYADDVSIFDGRQPMGDDDASSSLAGSVEGVLHDLFVVEVRFSLAVVSMLVQF